MVYHQIFLLLYEVLHRLNKMIQLNLMPIFYRYYIITSGLIIVNKISYYSLNYLIVYYVIISFSNKGYGFYKRIVTPNKFNKFVNTI